MGEIDRDHIAKSYDYWQKKAGSFDAQYEDGIFSLKSITNRFLNRRTDLIYDLVDFSMHDRVLDVGCGSGIHMAIFAHGVAEIIGSDYSIDMLQLCKTRLASAGVSNYKLLHCDAGLLPFGQDSFDRIISLGLLDYVENPGVVIAEFRRVLKDTGEVIFTIPKKPSIFSFFRSKFGIILRDKVFNLPPIISAVSRVELEGLLRSLAFEIQYLDSLWTTMWIVKANKR